jgi:hypothetical protein
MCEVNVVDKNPVLPNRVVNIISFTEKDFIKLIRTEAKVDILEKNLTDIISDLEKKLSDRLNYKIDALEKSLNYKISALEKNLNEKISALARVSQLGPLIFRKPNKITMLSKKVYYTHYEIHFA